jgi:hypothetical protein
MIVVMRMLNGEEIIGKIATDKDGSTTIENPCIIDTVISGAGQVKANMIPTALFCKDRTVLLNQHSVMWSNEATDEMANAYNAKYSTIITPPTKSILHS